MKLKQRERNEIKVAGEMCNMQCIYTQYTQNTHIQVQSNSQKMDYTNCRKYVQSEHLQCIVPFV